MVDALDVGISEDLERFADFFFLLDLVDLDRGLFLVARLS